MTLVTQHFHPESIGSAPQLTMIAKWLCQQGVGVRVITGPPSYPDRTSLAGSADSIDARIELVRLKAPLVSGRGIVARVIREVGFAVALAWHGRQDRDSRGTCLSLCPSVLVPLIASMGRPKHHVALVHDVPSGLAATVRFGRWLTGPLRLVERWAFNRADRVITLTPAMKEGLADRGVEAPITVLPPLIDTTHLFPLPEPADPFTLLYSGAFGHKQGFDGLWDLAAALQDRDPTMRIVLRGPGGGADMLKQAIAKRHLRNIEIVPLVADADLNTALGAAHVHLLLQDPKGAEAALPSKLFTSMAVGRPVLALAPHTSELASWIIRSGCGVVVPPGDAAAFCQAVQELATDGGRRAQLGMAGRKVAEESVSLDRIGRTLLAELKLNRQVGEPEDGSRQ